MALELANFYLCWRAERQAAAFRDAGDGPSEHVVQQIWQHQRIRRDDLKTCDGQPVRILHPGFWNNHAGPDFRQAMVQIGSEKRIGDIEIDLVPGGWEQHAHSKSERYGKVVLHVVWQASGRLSPLPTLELRGLIDAPLEQLLFWFGAHTAPPEATLGQCSAPLQNLPEPVLRDVLRQAARARLQYKAEVLQAMARQSGWEQALWEGIFGALGYSNNVWPMRRLAELRPLVITGAGGHSNPLLLVQSRLLGLSGLLPTETSRLSPGAKTYVQQLWHLWWREADLLRELALPKSIWNLAGLRPGNRPERRIALAAHWLLEAELPARLEQWLGRQIHSSELLDSLEKILTVPADPYWNLHPGFSGSALKQPQALLGENRASDIAINIILPWLWIRALAGRNSKMRAAAEKRYFDWPRSQDNAVLQFARKRLFGGAAATLLKTAAEQQGLLQIVRDFCDYSNARCENCPFPDLLKAIAVREL